MRNGPRHLFLTAHASRVLCSIGAPALVGLSSLLAGCGSDKTVSPPPPPPNDTVYIEDDENFTSQSTLKISSVAVPPGEDVKLCWKDFTTDIQGHTVDPLKDINDVSFIRVLSNSADDVAKLLNDGTLSASKIDGDWDIQMPNGTSNPCVNLSDMTIAASGPSGTPLDPKTSFTTSSTVTYLVVFANGTAIGYGARTMVILQPDDTSTTGEVDATNTTATLTYSATFSDKHVSVNASEAQNIDWSHVTTGGAMQEINRNDVSSVLIGFYKDMQPAELQKNFLNLDQMTGTYPGAPSMSWQVDVPSGQSTSIVGAKGRNGEPAFQNFETTDTGTWLMGMFCNTCQNPAPVIVTLVDPQASQ
ncbi:MAG TPA: hypothetical protein VMI54_30915 [Polyangiaceae bacterium]|nr:hypothetical protein [Polyangiaceae bacterium]